MKSLLNFLLKLFKKESVDLGKRLIAKSINAPTAMDRINRLRNK